MEERKNFYKAEDEHQANAILKRLKKRGYHTTAVMDLLNLSYPCSFFTNDAGEIILDYGVIGGASYHDFCRAWIKRKGEDEK